MKRLSKKLQQGNISIYNKDRELLNEMAKAKNINRSELVRIALDETNVDEYSLNEYRGMSVMMPEDLILKWKNYNKSKALADWIYNNAQQ